MSRPPHDLTRSHGQLVDASPSKPADRTPTSPPANTPYRTGRRYRLASKGADS